MGGKPCFDREHFRRLLTDAGLSVDHLAERLPGLDARTLQRLSSGKTRAPHPDTVKQIAAALGVAPAELWRYPSDQPANAPATAVREDPTAGSTPDDDNPFAPWTTAQPPRFVGRGNILSTLELAAREGRSVSLVGERRIGKSSLLQTWGGQAVALGLRVCLLSGEGAEAAGHQAFVAGVIGATAPPGPGAAEAPLSETISESPDAAANQLARWCGETRPVILLDEAEGFLVRCEPRFLERLRGMVNAKRLSLVLATRRDLDAIYQDLGRTSPFPNLLELCRVGLLDESAARALIARGAAHWRTDDPAWLLDWAGAHPFYLTLLARRLFDARRGGEARECALERFRDEAESQLRLWWTVLDPRDQERLRQSAAGRPRDDFRLQVRGLLTADGHPFGKVLTTWLNETR